MKSYASALNFVCCALLSGAILSHAEDTASAQTATNVPTPAVSVPGSGQLVTIDGTVYRQAHIERVEPDGIVVTFAPPGGGVGMAKLKFRNLPPDVQRRYGYDAQQSAEYETEQERSLEEFRDRMWADFDGERTTRAQARQENEQELAQQEQQRLWEQEQEEAGQAFAEQPPPMPMWWDWAIVNGQPAGFAHHHRSTGHRHPAAPGIKRGSTRQAQELPPPTFSQFPPPGFRQLPLPTPHQPHIVISRPSAPTSAEEGHSRRSR